MLKTVGVSQLDELIDKTVPSSIRLKEPMAVADGMSEFEYLNHLRGLGAKNKLFRSYIGQGYYGTITPSVVLRNVLENPSWYTSYTPYQAEISQGRLEALLNFQTMVAELTALPMANASLLDEATAAAEAMIMLHNARPRAAVKAGVNKFFVDENIFPQTLDVLMTRAEPLGIELMQGDYQEAEMDESFFGAFVQFPAADGSLRDYAAFTEKAHAVGVKVAVAADLMSLVLLTPPREWGADVAVGSTQRFGIPMGFGGPHAAYFATREEYKRNLPGRIIGVSVDSNGNPALRMALQTREQHIKRERATSNICTAQALLATMAGMYGQYHGPKGLKRIASHIFTSACTLNDKLKEMGIAQKNESFFDTLHIQLPEGVSTEEVRKAAEEKEINFFYKGSNELLISADETMTTADLNDILQIFAGFAKKAPAAITKLCDCTPAKEFMRQGDFLQISCFNRYHSETEMMRYIKMLERKDFSLTHSMISLGSCTMKLNAASELFALSWPEFAGLHPFVPTEQAEGYYEMMKELEDDLKVITGFDAISFQPNSGAAGEYAGLMVIRQYQKENGQGHRNVVLIPASAHGTNPASAVMAGMKVVVVKCDENGNVDLADLKRLAEEHAENLSSLMITYPSTHGVFEEEVVEIIGTIHQHGGQVYMDGANMNAQVGLTNPGIIGADVCHLNLHKTFAIPHGGGGPGMGPIGVAKHLTDYLPNHPLVETGGVKGSTAIAAAPFGSAHILTISHGYIKMMGDEGLTEATKIAILNANYLAAALKDHYQILYKGAHGYVGHEMILECRNFKPEAGITEADIAKRLMDYGFHAPTLSFPVHGTLMVEPTESESREELDRFVEAMKSIWQEIQEVKNGEVDKENNVLHHAPHTAKLVTSDSWDRPYAREKAAYPLAWIVENKFWPTVGRVDDGHGDRNLMCTCEPIDSYRNRE